MIPFNNMTYLDLKNGLSEMGYIPVVMKEKKAQHFSIKHV